MPATPETARALETFVAPPGERSGNHEPADRRPPPGLVTRDHVRELLAAHVSALDVMSRAELVRRIGTDSPFDRELDLLAGMSNTLGAQLGA